MGTRKYRLTDETVQITRNGKEVTLHRIEALRDFGDVKAGERGGYVESKANLSHDGNCWVFDTANVCGNAKVYDNAWICGNAKVFGDATVYGDALVYGFAEVHGCAEIYGNAEVSGSSKVCGDTMLGV